MNQTKSSGGILQEEREGEREREGRKLPLVYISSCLLIPPHVSERDSLDMGVMVIMVIYDSFLQLLPSYHIGCMFFSRKGAEWIIIILYNKKGLTLIWSNCTLFAHLEQFLCALASLVLELARWRRVSQAWSCTPVFAQCSCVCVDVLC